MSNFFKTEQEKFWASNFGDEYIDRNKSEKLIASNFSLFSKILKNTKNINSVIELGANIGLNLQVIKQLCSNINLNAVEINKQAADKLKFIDNNIKVYNQSILDFKTDEKYDFVFTKGVLIHINPAELNTVYDLIYKISNKYICVIEYYNPTPVHINYRGYSDRLFKRDFAGEFLDKFKNLNLLDYGFIYHRDNVFAQDDITWFLMEKE
ncbi:MAG: pseudaminic acid biosynthesis-associated methylase [Candidatus Babeliales bacterium]